MRPLGAAGLRGLLVALAALALARNAAGEDLEEVLRGFETLMTSEFAEPAPPSARAWHLAGGLELSAHVAPLPHRATSGTRYAGLTLLRGRLDLLFELQLPRLWQLRVGGYAFADAAYRIHGRSRFTAQMLDRYEWEADFREAWLGGPIHWNLDLAMGRQIVPWGRADDLRVLDVLNPVDAREPGLTDIEVIRLPVSMVQVSTRRGPWTLAALAIPELRFSIEPPYGSDFYPEFPLKPPPGLDPDSLDPGDIEIVEPESRLAHTSWALSLTGVFPGWDLSLYWARLWEDRPVFETDLRASTCCPVQLPPLRARYFRGQLFGAAASLVWGPWLFEAEAAARRGLRYTASETLDTPVGPVRISTGTLEKWRLDGLLGVEYWGFASVAISLELALRHVLDFDERMRAFGAVPEQGEAALRITARFLGERLETTVLVHGLGDPVPDAGALRLSAEYALRDGVTLSAAAVAYKAGSLRSTREIGRNHRLSLGIEYAF